MPVDGYELILKKLTEIEKAVSELKATDIRNEKKRLECQQHFDDRYIHNKTFNQRFNECLEVWKDKSRTTFSYFRDWLIVLNTVVLLILTITRL